jgi:hypothetical protein
MSQERSLRDLPVPGQQPTPRYDGANEIGYFFPVDDPSTLGGQGETGREGMERTGHTAREGVRSLRETGRANLPAEGAIEDASARDGESAATA